MRTFLPILFSIWTLAGTVSAAAQELPGARTIPGIHNDPYYGHIALNLPAATDAGSWDGTWIYYNRDVRFALWIREEAGEPIVKLRYLGAYLTPETFETDWAGSSRYFLQDKPVTFDFKLTSTSPTQLEANWDWVLDLAGSGRTEHAKLEIYRSGDGRRMVMYFKEFERVVMRAGKVFRFDKAQSWTFTKISKRLVRWEELPL